jgi:hypothetical protein
MERMGNRDDRRSEGESRGFGCCRKAGDDLSGREQPTKVIVLPDHHVDIARWYELWIIQSRVHTHQRSVNVSDCFGGSCRMVYR